MACFFSREFASSNSHMLDQIKKLEKILDLQAHLITKGIEILRKTNPNPLADEKYHSFLKIKEQVVENVDSPRKIEEKRNRVVIGEGFLILIYYSFIYSLNINILNIQIFH